MLSQLHESATIICISTPTRNGTHESALDIVLSAFFSVIANLIGRLIVSCHIHAICLTTCPWNAFAFAGVVRAHYCTGRSRSSIVDVKLYYTIPFPVPAPAPLPQLLRFLLDDTTARTFTHDVIWTSNAAGHDDELILFWWRESNPLKFVLCGSGSAMWKIDLTSSQ